MDNTLLILIWLFGSIAIASGACMLAKHFGVAFLIAMFVGGIVVANATVAKLVQIGPFVTSASLIAYSITFVVSDCLCEFWGKKIARRTVWAAFTVYAMFVFTTQVSIGMQAPVFYEGQGAFASVFGSSLQVGIASILAYTVAQNHDVWMYHLLKKRTGGKYLWLRNNISTGLSQVIDSIRFFGIAFWGTPQVLQLIIGSILIKRAVAACDTPFLYLIRWYYTKVGKPFVRPTET